jgi:hypothetical protein
MRPSDIMVAFRLNRMTHCAATNALPVRCCPATPKQSTMRQAKIAPIGIVIQIFFMTSGFGPPAAKVPAHETKIAHGGRCAGVKTVVAASRDATISAGNFFMAFPRVANFDDADLAPASLITDERDRIRGKSCFRAW